ncbi:MAG: hypothetical protein K2N56_07120 [Oscillospiraceae bacterium]|nr:hypothetical protein [Oscillospiraceae bacterium]
MKIKFKSALHRKNFTGYISPKNTDYYSNRNEFIAAVFLLSADKLLWERSKSALTSYSVNFGLIDLSGISTEGYALYKAAKTVYNDDSATGSCKVAAQGAARTLRNIGGDSDISLSELCDWTLLDDPTALTIFAGVMLRRNGIGMLNWRS